MKFSFLSANFALMKKFKTNTIIFIVILKVLLACNFYFLFELYESISMQTEELIMHSLKEADLDEVLNRPKYYPEIDGEAEYKGKAMSQSRSIEGDTLYVTIKDGNDSILSLRNIPLPHGTNYSDIMVNEIAYGAHQTIDPVYPLRINDMDSLFKLALEKKGIKPKITSVMSISENGEIIKGDFEPENKAALDSISYYYNLLTGDRYIAYYSSPLSYILRQMAGILISNIALIIAFTLAFRYLYRTVSRLRSIEEMKDDFVNNMTHELKTPIAIAYSANDALLNHNADKDFSKRENYLNIANRQLKRLEELVESILSMSMERRNTMELKIESIELGPFIQELIMAQMMRKDKVINIKNCIEDRAKIVADKACLSNVINNLIDNAIKYSGQIVNINITGNEKEISISDNGIGIPEKSLPYIFDKFYRVPHGNRHDISGYGIGLYYVKSISDRMGWTISVRSKVGTGSIFTIHFKTNEK